MRIVLSGLALAAVIGCVAEPSREMDAGPFPVSQLEEWRVLADSEVIGYLVLLEVQHPNGAVRFFQARTKGGGRLGRITLEGRFYKWELFEEELAELGLYSMKEGLALLFDVPGSISISIIPRPGRGQPTEAAAHKLLESATKRRNP